MSFTQAGGYLGTVPESEAALPAVRDLYHGWPDTGFKENLTTFCRSHRVTAIVIGPGTPEPLAAALEQLPWKKTTDQRMRLVWPPGATK
jgi:hypothetical protein